MRGLGARDTPFSHPLLEVGAEECFAQVVHSQVCTVGSALPGPILRPEDWASNGMEETDQCHWERRAQKAPEGGSPASAVCLVLRMRNGTCSHLRTEAPSTVLSLIREATRLHLRKECAGKASKVWPLRKLVRSGGSREWTRHEAGLGSTAAGGQWPQQRLYRVGHVDSELRQACARLATGTVARKLWWCASPTVDRAEHCRSELVQALS